MGIFFIPLDGGCRERVKIRIITTGENGNEKN